MRKNVRLEETEERKRPTGDCEYVSEVARRATSCGHQNSRASNRAKESRVYNLKKLRLKIKRLMKVFFKISHRNVAGSGER